MLEYGVALALSHHHLMLRAYFCSNTCLPRHFGFVPRTVSTIVREVNETIVWCLWKRFLSAYMPVTDQDFESKISDMEDHCQFPFNWCGFRRVPYPY